MPLRKMPGSKMHLRTIQTYKSQGHCGYGRIAERGQIQASEDPRLLSLRTDQINT